MGEKKEKGQENVGPVKTVVFYTIKGLMFLVYGLMLVGFGVCVYMEVVGKW